MKLTTNLSEPLLELLRDGGAPIDGIETGPWHRPRDIAEYRKRFPQFPFYFHGGDLINRVGLLPGAVRSILEYIRAAGSPWLSLHITFFPPGARALLVRTGLRIGNMNPGRAQRSFVRRVRELPRRAGVPVILENPDPVAGWPNGEIQPERISSILEETGCGLLLDVAHARLSAERLGVTAEDYLSRLPMDRVVQIHASGPRTRGGYLCDAHEPLQAADYELLEFAWRRSKPQVVTLEYIRRKDALREQLARLRSMIDARNPG
jgi:hypothetical protein